MVIEKVRVSKNAYDTLPTLVPGDNLTDRPISEMNGSMTGEKASFLPLSAKLTISAFFRLYTRHVVAGLRKHLEGLGLQRGYFSNRAHFGAACRVAYLSSHIILQGVGETFVRV